jgi:large subunit ribosomal protein L24
MNSALLLSPWGQQVMKNLMKSRQKFKSRFETTKWTIVKGDQVEVIQGPQVGQRGKVLAVLRAMNRIIIDGVNLRRRIVKPRSDGTPGRIVTRPCSIHYSNVMLIDPTSNKPTKTLRRYLEDGSKIRISKTTGTHMPKPYPLADRPPRSALVGAKDTAEKDVFEVTFDEYEKYKAFIYKKK